ncbi:MAG: MBL fold metallo-hydrolase [Porticoccaceae bacterium]
MRPCPPDRLLKDGDVVPIAGFDLKLVHTPGHCPEEVVYWQAETRQMFSGDHLLPDITPVCLLDIPTTVDGPRTKTLVQYYESADKVKPYPAKAVYPSHGDVFQDHLALITSYRLSTERRLLKISRILAEHGDLTALEVGQKLFPKAWEDQLYAVISEVVGHLDMLEAGGHVSWVEKEGLLRYCLESVPEPS